MRIANAYHLRPAEVRYGWSYADSLEVHLTLDALDGIKLACRPDLPKQPRKR